MDAAVACSRKAGSSRPPKPGASLADKRPDVVADWNWDRNSNITPDQVGVNSARMIWWRCSDCGHEWSSPIKSRVRSRTHRRGICPGDRGRRLVPLPAKAMRAKGSEPILSGSTRI
ncbi:zinc-ribbon domain-containing protein [Rhodococcus wratislaviensis]|uniref:zinc-ribbon domain-containing protein n=1 Tax=Rhodococcus wratislaviensis TaxID=44752 RepID=UPI001788B36D